MKINGKEVTVENAYDLLATDEKLVNALEATDDERERLCLYGMMRAHNDYLDRLQVARGGRY